MLKSSRALCACAFVFLLSSCAPESLQRKGLSLSEKEARLDTILETRGETHKQRYEWRHPKETLLFFGIEPGMAVAEALPGGNWKGSWYSQLLAPYLGAEGRLLGVDYSIPMWENFGFADNFMSGRMRWAERWVEGGEKAADADSAKLEGATFATLGGQPDETLDAVLFIRALHNLARFNKDGHYLTSALQEAHRILKRGGILGVVQHQAPESRSDDWASGARGYLKKSKVIEWIQEQGFRLVDSSDINENPKDQPGPDDKVWRLPPTPPGSKDDPDLRAEREAIGESNRMTLLFKKI